MYAANLRATTKNRHIIDVIWKGRKWSHIKYSVKTTKGRKSVEDKIWNKEQEIENSNNMVDINPAMLIIILNISSLYQLKEIVKMD